MNCAYCSHFSTIFIACTANGSECNSIANSQCTNNECECMATYDEGTNTACVAKSE